MSGALPNTLECGVVLDGRYILKECIGRGGMGEVWLARDQRLNRLVVAKLIQAAQRTAANIRRFRDECRQQAQCIHPHIAIALDCGEDPIHSVYLILEYVEGVHLAASLRAAPERSFTWQRAVRLMLQILAALAVIHRKGFVLRDLKPTNILVTGDEPVEMVKVIDFGIAKPIDCDVTRAVKTQAGVLYGTPPYMSPEQARQAVLDHRSDLFSAAIVFYEMMAGYRPFANRPDPRAVLVSIAASEPKTLPLHGIPESIASFVLRGLEKNPDARFESAEAMAAALERARDEALALPRPTPRPWPRRVTFASAALALVAVGFALAIPRTPELRAAQSSTWVAISQGADLTGEGSVQPATSVEVAPPARPEPSRPKPAPKPPATASVMTDAELHAAVLSCACKKISVDLARRTKDERIEDPDLSKLIAERCGQRDRGCHAKDEVDEAIGRNG